MSPYRLTGTSRSEAGLSIKKAKPWHITEQRWRESGKQPDAWLGTCQAAQRDTRRRSPERNTETDAARSFSQELRKKLLTYPEFCGGKVSCSHEGQRKTWANLSVESVCCLQKVLTGISGAKGQMAFNGNSNLWKDTTSELSEDESDSLWSLFLHF